MRDGLYSYDGIRTVPLSGLREWNYWTQDGRVEDEAVDVATCYAAVPWLYRGVDIRAKAVAAMPYALYVGKSKKDVAEQAAYKPIVDALAANLYRTEAALVLTAQSYWLTEKNRTPRWVVPATVAPNYDTAKGVVSYTRTIDTPTGKVSVTLDPRNVVAFWLPSLTTELGPGVAPAAVALAAAKVLYNLDTFAAAFFQRGAIRATLLTVEGTPPASEMERLQKWWSKMLRGVRDAYKSIAIKASVKPLVIGDGIKEMESAGLTNTQREHISTALGVPHSLLFSSALAGGTVDAERLNFITQTIAPECDLVEEALNRQWLSPLGLRLKFTPEKLEVMQAAELAKAEAISKLVPGGTVLTVDEARDLLGYGPMPKDAAPAPAVAPEPAQQATADAGEVPPGSSSRSADLAKWQRKALKRLARGDTPDCGFESDYLADGEVEAIRSALAGAVSADDVRTAFRAASDVEQLIDGELQAAFDLIRKVASE